MLGFAIAAYDLLEADPQLGPLLKLAHSLHELSENFLGWVEVVEFREHFGEIISRHLSLFEQLKLLVIFGEPLAHETLVSVVRIRVQARNEGGDRVSQLLVVQNEILSLWITQLLVPLEEHANSHVYAELLLFGQSHNLFPPLFQDFFVLVFAVFDVSLDHVFLLFFGVLEHRRLLPLLLFDGPHLFLFDVLSKVVFQDV